MLTQENQHPEEEYGWPSSPVILREEICGESGLGNRGGATTASGILGPLGARKNGARYSQSYLLNFSSSIKEEDRPPKMAIFQ